MSVLKGLIDFVTSSGKYSLSKQVTLTCQDSVNGDVTKSVFNFTSESFNRIYLSRFQQVLRPDGEEVIDFSQLEEGGIYRAIKVDQDRKNRAQVDDAMFEFESALTVCNEIKKHDLDAHLYNNVKLFDGSDITTKYDAIVLFHHHSLESVAILLEAKYSVHPKNIDELIDRKSKFQSFISSKHMFHKAIYGANSYVAKPSDFFLLHKVTTVVPCLAGKMFPENLQAECHRKGITSVYPSGARYIVNTAAPFLRFMR